MSTASISGSARIVNNAIEMIGGMTPNCTAQKQVKLVVDDFGMSVRVADLHADPFYDERHGLVLAVRLPDEADLHSVSRWLAQPAVRGAFELLLDNISAEDCGGLYVNDRARQVLAMFWPGGPLDPAREVSTIWGVN